MNLQRITLKDGAVKEGKKWLTSPMDVAREISVGLAASCLIAQVRLFLLLLLLFIFFWFFSFEKCSFNADCLICWGVKVNGTLWDMNRPLEDDCTLVLFKFDSNEGRDTFWHSSAHILGEVN